MYYRIEAVTSSDQKASVARLQMFIEVCSYLAMLYIPVYSKLYICIYVAINNHLRNQVYQFIMWTLPIFDDPTHLYVSRFAKWVLYTHSNFQRQGCVTQLVLVPRLWNVVAELSYHCTYVREKVAVIGYSQMELCLFKVDVCIWTLFANPVTQLYIYTCN